MISRKKQLFLVIVSILVAYLAVLDKFHIKDIFSNGKTNVTSKTKRNFFKNLFATEEIVKKKSKKEDANYIDGVKALFNDFLEEIRERNKDIPPKETGKTITIKLLLKDSIYGLEETNLEAEFFTDVLNEWAKGAFPTYEENIKFDISVFTSTDKLKDLVSSYLYVKSSEYDIMMLDIAWVGQFKDYLLNVQSIVSSNTTKLFKQTNLNSCKYGTKLVALPLYTDYGIMMYRKDLLDKYEREIPRTWDQIEETALYILEKEHESGNKNLEGYAGQFAAYEGLTCNIMEWIYSYRENYESECEYFANDAAVHAMEKLEKFFDEGVMSADNLEYMENESLAKWLDGNVIFIRNWPGTIKTSQLQFDGTPIEFGVIMLPGQKEGLSAATLGGWTIGVSKYSSNQFISAKTIEFLSGEELQKFRARHFNILPTMSHLYEDSEVCETVQCDLFRDMQGVLRPSDDSNYSEYSKIIYDSVRKVLMKKATIDDAIRIIVNFTESKLKLVLSTIMKIEYYFTMVVVGCIIVSIIIYSIYFTFVDK